MTPHELLNSKKDWRDKVALIVYQHSKMCIKDDKWTIKDTAKYFGVSVGLVSENLLLFKHFDRLKVFSTRKAALTVLRINGY